jgi:hypothetical protein
LDKHKALALLGEILDISIQIKEVNSISIGQKFNENFYLKIDCKSVLVVKEKISPIIAKVNLIIKQEEDSLLIMDSK